MSELKSKGADIVRQVQATGRPVVLTRHGRGVAVVVSLKDYEELQEAAEHLRLQRALDLGLEQGKNGETHSHAQIREKLAVWAKGAKSCV